MTKAPSGKHAVFLDRDGTINVEKNYLYQPSEWDWIPGAIDAIKLLNDNNFLVVVVSNQSGIARKMYGHDDVHYLHDWVSHELAKSDAWIDGYYYCPHHPEFGVVRDCDCRKPKIGMFTKAATDLDIAFDRSWMIGDKIIDMDAGRSAGTNTIMVLTGHGTIEAKAASSGQLVVPDVLQAVRVLLS